MEKDLLAAIKTTGDNLVAALNAFTQEQINKVPFEGSWTAAQVGDHVLKSAGGVLQVLNGPAEPAQRERDEKVAGLRDIFLDFSVKMKSPMEILPTNEPQEKESVIAALQTVLAGLYTAAETLDLSATCTAFDMPGFGRITRFEWLHFFLYHTQRHTRQIENIYQAG